MSSTTSAVSGGASSNTKESSSSSSLSASSNPKEEPEKSLLEQANILPAVFDILRSSERDDTNKDPAEAAQRVLDLSSRIEKLRERIKGIEGIAYTKESLGSFV
ncbi:Mediator of RNA polymerase II transcription subunit 9 [Caligus rogercresseyi]|uniref:Mediator of RNA polymerase II transcription subunit 9 n=1 Tax=Caligus rogercresseyi TaxID=217165 RepID=A0A7T8QUN1_CALRO|nr:Mediator of RNA polymerase II transcription subunit 9 [Caligus rogercresseyi]